MKPNLAKFLQNDEEEKNSSLVEKLKTIGLSLSMKLKKIKSILQYQKKRRTTIEVKIKTKKSEKNTSSSNLKRPEKIYCYLIKYKKIEQENFIKTLNRFAEAAASKTKRLFK